MIFPSEAVIETRRRLFAGMKSGAIARDDAFRKALEADPDDITAVRFLAISALDADDFDRAERYARDFIRLHPSDFEGYLVLSRVLNEDEPSSPLINAYAQLAFEKILDDDEAMEGLDTDGFAEHLGCPGLVQGLAKDEAVTALSEYLKRHRDSEPESVVRELEPHRLIAQLCKSWDSLLEPEVVDAIVRKGEACAPLLLGILKEWGEDLLTEDDRPVVERALALLGEIGSLAALPALVEFLIRQDDDLSGAADWAFRRITWQHPAAALEKIREMISQSGGAERAMLAPQIGLMPDVPGRSEALTSLIGGIEHLPREEREALVVGAIVGIMMVEGRHSPLAASLEQQYGGLLSRESRSNIRDIRRDVPDGPFAPEPTEITIHQICCEAPDAGEDEEETGQPIVQAPKPGRNDPCWCGSGKKYKKCHLDHDQGL